jgi:hypothetical protein
MSIRKELVKYIRAQSDSGKYAEINMNKEVFVVVSYCV